MPPKRKRPDRPSGDGGRPSPHRPGDTNLAQHDGHDTSARGRGARGGHFSHGQRGGFNRRDSSQGYGRGGSGHHNQQNHSRNQGHAQPPSPAKQPPSSPSAPRQPPTGPSQSQPSTQISSSLMTKPPSEPTQRPVSPVRSNYRYENLTDDKVQTWDERGRREIIQQGVQARDDVDITELSSLFQEFIQAVVEQRLPASDAGACIKEILGDEDGDVVKDAYAFAPHTLFLDSLAIIMDNDSGLYRPTLREFLIATQVSPALMRQILDAPILQQLGLIRDNFARLGVRQATNLLYRQANYNLLREETEGYSKLITELFSTNTVTPPPPELAEQTFERVKGLIGTFDLDVGRVLDVTLDVAAAVLIKQYKFFVKFLRVSSWWPRAHFKYDTVYNGGLPPWADPGYLQWTATEEDEERITEQKLARDVAFWDRAREVHLGAFFELGGRQVSEADLEQAKITNGRETKHEADFEQQWMEETKTLPPPGNRVAAQLLGFKLLFYNSEMRDKSDVLPANLLYLAALLIKIGFLSLTDLYPHLSPPDDNMDKIREAETEKLEQEERAARGGGRMNALLMAGVLPQGDDDNPNASSVPKREAPKKADADTKQTTKEDSETKNKLPEPLEQKVSLLTQLLTIGAIPESLFILGRFPWIPEVFPDILQRIHRILHISLEKVYNDARPTTTASMDCPIKQLPDIDQSGMPKGSVRLHTPPPKKQWRWPYPEKFDVNENQNYRFYWDEWADNIPVCQTVDDVFTLCNTFLNLSGVNIGKDEALLSKLASIGSKSLADDNSAANLTRWHDLLRRLMLPALSHTKANASVVNAIWDLLRHYPLTTRYSMYAEWFEGQISRLPAMKSAFARATADTRGTMKRVSLTNLSEMAKQLAKTSYSSPGIVFRVAFEQLESYPNLIEAFVECAKYFTDLSYDVLIWSLLNSLGKSRSRTQAEHALTTSKWLQALSRFSGKVFRRYQVLSPTPVLQYVNDQLFRGNSTDLIILKEFISSMGGIVDSVDFTDYQVLSMAGGAWLRRYTLIRAQDRRFDNIKSSKRFMQALVDSKLAAQLLLNLAQYRQAAIFKVPDDEAHIKFLSSVVDDSHQTLIQYLDLLWSNLDSSTFDAIVPSISELISTYGLDTSMAFLIGRTSLGHRIFPWKGAKNRKKEPNARPITDKEGDVDMPEPKAQGEEPKDPESQEAGESEEQKSEDVSLTRTMVNSLQPIIESIQSAVRPEVWQKISPELYATFWALQLGDICFPEEIYVRERQRIMSEWQTLSSDRSDMSRKGIDRRTEKRKELMDLQGYLLDELSEHGLRKAKWKYFLTRQFQTSFPDAAAKTDSVSDVLLEQCLLPRVLLSPADAEYTFRFVKALHEWNAPVFKLMSLYDRLFNANRLRSLIFTCTVREAEYLGRFLKLILEDLSRWHKNELIQGDKDNKAAKHSPKLGAYDKEGKGTPEQPHFGFALTVNDEGKPETFVEHAQFRDLLFRWHKNLNMALKNCLGGSEWMHIRNGITVLKTVLDFFPAVDFMATQFTTQLQNITKREAASKTSPDNEEGGRVDLSVAAQGAMSELQRRKSKWVMVQAFRQNAVAGSRQEASKASATALRPTAPDFKPQVDRTPSAKHMTAEEEDGEVQDREAVRETSGAPEKELLPPKPAGNGRDSAKQSDTAGQSRSSTPKPGSFKNEPRAHKLPDRPSHNLPSRPDVPIPGHFTPERFPQSRGHDRRDGREARGPRDGRDNRDNRDTRDSRDAKDHRESRQSDSERPVRGRDFGDRRSTDHKEENGRAELPPRPTQSERERPHREPRGSRDHDRPQESSVTDPAPASDAHEPAMNPERAALFAQDTPDRSSRAADVDRASRGRRQGGGAVMDTINPERAALIGDRDDGTHNAPGRLNRDDGRERVGPRGQSPRRNIRHGNEQATSAPGARDERQSHNLQDQRPSGRDHRDRSPLPGNFRGDRSTDREGDRTHPDTLRDGSGFHRSGPRPQEPENRKPYQDQNYGRLNPVPQPPNAEIPSGPRGRGRNASRGGHGQPSLPGRPDNRFGPPETPRAPSPERHGPPTGPSSGRNRRGYESGGGPQTPAGTPAGPSGRNRNFNQTNDKPSPANLTAPSTSGVHPDRLAQLGGPPSAPQGTQRHHNQAANTPDRPQPSSRGGPGPDAETPTGPAGGDRPGRGGGRRQLAGINSTLQQAHAKMPEPPRSGGNRSNQPRQMLGNSDIQVLAGGSPTPTPSQERQDTMWGSSNGGDNQGRRDHDRSRSDRENRSERSNRTSRRSSRERERDGKDPSQGRDRRSMGGPDAGGSREERESRRQPRDSMGPPPPSSGRDNRHRGDGPPAGGNWGAEDWSGNRGGSGGGRGAGPRDGSNQPGDRRDHREDRGRKRRSEEGVGNLTSEREKRPRR